MLSFLEASYRDAFVFTQLRYSGEWDPFPDMWGEVISYLTTTTSIKAYPQRKIVTINEEIFNFPFVWVLGKSAFPPLSGQEIKILRTFFERGGMMFIDDSSDVVDSRFRQSVKEELAKVFPERAWREIPISHAIFRSFYLLRGVSGRRIWRNHLEGILHGEKYVVVFSANDISGTWSKDRFGNYLYECIPHRERQRWEAQKLVINVIMYSLTGTYKGDAVHQPFIERKLQ